MLARRRVLGAAVAAWTLAAWGGRIGLLTAPEAAEAVTWLRVGGSLATGLAGAAALAVGGGGTARRTIGVYAAWTAGVWGTSLVDVWTHDHPLGFRLVHTALAAVSVGLAGAALRAGRAVVAAEA